MSLTPRPDHNDFLDALKDAVSMTAQMMPAEEALAVASQFIGMMIAAMPAGNTAEQAAEIVRRNIEVGNASCMAEYRKRG